MSTLPVLCLPHGGGPLPVLGEASHTAMVGWVSSLTSRLPSRPTAVLVISAHWEESLPTVQTAASPDLLYDYYGFPKEAYDITYPSKGSPELAHRVKALLEAGGMATAEDPTRGYDHGHFIPMRLLFPSADVPTIQVSLLKSLNAREHLRMGACLRPLRDEGVLIVGSGMPGFHNMAGFALGGPGDSEGASVSAAFDDWLAAAVTSANPRDRDKHLEAWKSAAPRARAAHPREEHLLPLLVCAGAAGDDTGVRDLKTEILGTQQSGFVFGTLAAKGAQVA